MRLTMEERSRKRPMTKGVEVFLFVAQIIVLDTGTRRQLVPRDPLPRAVMGTCRTKGSRWRSTRSEFRRGAAAGLSGLTTDHLRPLLWSRRRHAFVLLDG